MPHWHWLIKCLIDTNRNKYWQWYELIWLFFPPHKTNKIVRWKSEGFMHWYFPLLPLLKLLCLFYLHTPKHKLLEMLVILTLSISYCWSWETNCFQLSVYKALLSVYKTFPLTPLMEERFFNLKTLIIWNLYFSGGKMNSMLFQDNPQRERRMDLKAQKTTRLEKWLQVFSCVFLSQVYTIF